MGIKFGLGELALIESDIEDGICEPDWRESGELVVIAQKMDAQRQIWSSAGTVNDQLCHQYPHAINL